MSSFWAAKTSRRGHPRRAHAEEHSASTTLKWAKIKTAMGSWIEIRCMNCSDNFSVHEKGIAS